MNKKISDIRYLVVFAACGCGAFLHAADRNWISGGSAQWTNAVTWAEGVVPTAADNVYLKLNSTLAVRLFGVRTVNGEASVGIYSHVCNNQSTTEHQAP